MRMYGDKPPDALRYGEGKTPSVTQILKHLGLAPSLDHIDRDVLAEKGQIGTEVHSWIEDDLRGQNRLFDERHPRTEGYIDAYKNLISIHDLDADHLELRMETEQIGGTVDFIGRMDGRPTILDWKTRYDGSYPHDQLQLTGYLYLAKMLKHVRGDYDLVCVALHDDGTFTIKNYEPDMPVWLGAIALWWWKRRMGLLGG